MAISELEYILALDKWESASAKTTLALSFIQSQHSICEYAAFFHWLANELDKGETEFVNQVFDNLKLNKSSARLLSIWLLRIVA